MGLMRNAPVFIPLHLLALRLGLSRAWLKAEAEANRIPCVRAGRRLMFHQAAVERALIGQTATVADQRGDASCAT
jgi:hypothetical protein